MPRNIKETDFSSEFEIKAIRSSGPGGQNVNKVSTRIELRFNVMESRILTQEEKLLILKKLKKKISNEGMIIIVSQSTRSQLKNRDDSIRKFYELIEKTLKPVKKRISSSPTYNSKLKRLEDKKQQSEKKVSRSHKKIHTQSDTN